jgi:hypothetical protein
MNVQLEMFVPKYSQAETEKIFETLVFNSMLTWFLTREDSLAHLFVMKALNPV